MNDNGARTIAAMSALAFAAAAAAQTTLALPMPSDVEIRKILAQRIDVEHQSLGIAVGIVESGGKRVVTYGSLDNGDKRTPDGNTVFEIGSVTKVFTSLLLTDMVERGEVKLTDPVAKYLPANVKVPERGGKSITLLDLSTHTSGLPRLPTGFNPRDTANPYADYSTDQLFQFLSSYTLTRDIGAQYEYSNLGGGLLGLALARRAGMDYEALVRARLLDPLHMNDTRVTLSPELKGRMAAGHVVINNEKLDTVPNWDWLTLGGAGALRSTTNDMLTFLSAELGYTKTPLAPAMAAMLAVRRPTGTPALDIGLAWHVFIRKNDGSEVVWHNGGTGGFRSFIGFDRKRGVGVVVLSNASTAAGVDDIALHLFDPQLPLFVAPMPYKEITIDPKLFDRYVGQYQVGPKATMTITRDGSRFFAQLTGQSQFEIFAESERDYFLKVVDAQITFETDGDGRTNALVLHQAGRDVRFARSQ